MEQYACLAALIVLVVVGLSQRKPRALRRCPNCGAEFVQPLNESTFLCSSCGKPGPWASPDQVAKWSAGDAARGAIRAILSRVTAGESPEKLSGDLAAIESSSALSPPDLKRARQDAYADFARGFIEDRILTDDEDALLASAGTLVGLNWTGIAEYDFRLFDLIFAAWIKSSGPRLVRESSGLSLRQGEYLAYELPAWLHEDVSVGSFSAQTSELGATAPLFGGVEGELKFGTISGTTTQDSTSVASDKGSLYITTDRLVFMGAGHSAEIPLDQVNGVMVQETPYRRGFTMRRLVVSSSARGQNLELSLDSPWVAKTTIEWLRDPPEVPTPLPPPGAEYPLIEHRQLAKVMKDPDSAKGTLMTVYGEVHQFDTRTGPEGFLCFIGSQRSDRFSSNAAYMVGTAEMLKDVVKGDLFEAGVSVAGVVSYRSPMGLVFTRPELALGRITVYGNVDS